MWSNVCQNLVGYLEAWRPRNDGDSCNCSCGKFCRLGGLRKFEGPIRQHENKSVAESRLGQRTKNVGSNKLQWVVGGNRRILGYLLFLQRTLWQTWRYCIIASTSIPIWDLWKTHRSVSFSRRSPDCHAIRIVCKEAVTSYLWQQKYTVVKSGLLEIPWQVCYLLCKEINVLVTSISLVSGSICFQLHWLCWTCTSSTCLFSIVRLFGKPQRLPAKMENVFL